MAHRPMQTNGHSHGTSSDKKAAISAKVPSRLYNPEAQPPSLEALKQLIARDTDPTIYPLATTITKNVPIYDLAHLSSSNEAQIAALQDQLHHIFLSGPGVVVLKHMYTDHDVIDATNAAFGAIIAREKNKAGGSKGDHFAASGKNDRIWNSFQKHALEDPKSFVQYYSNPWLDIVCNAWLGPGYRVTAQTNIVKPGGAAQVSHRDYHLGFQTTEECAKWPRAMQIASQQLTLQGAVAHSDMPLESGPARFLPFSQLFEEGFIAYRREEFVKFFEDEYVSLPLEKGDGVFFNPALFHAAGANVTVEGGIERRANLLQVSSAFGKPMESVDSVQIVETCWADMKSMYRNGSKQNVSTLVKAVGEGYPFPTNLDKRPPAPGGMAPECEQDIILQGLKSGWDRDRMICAMMQMRHDTLA